MKSNEFNLLLEIFPCKSFLEKINFWQTVENMRGKIASWHLSWNLPLHCICICIAGGEKKDGKTIEKKTVNRKTSDKQKDSRQKDSRNKDKSTERQKKTESFSRSNFSISKFVGVIFYETFIDWKKCLSKCLPVLVD